MNERQKRLIEVYEHLRRFFGIHTKTGFAEALHYGRTSLSAAMNGDENYLTDSLFKNICAVYPGVFNLDYLLNGCGDLLAHEENKKENEQPSFPFDLSSVIKDAVELSVAAKQETIDVLKSQMADLRTQMDDLRIQLVEKDQLIALLREKITALEAAEELFGHHIDHHTFPMGVADKDVKNHETLV